MPARHVYLQVPARHCANAEVGLSSDGPWSHVLGPYGGERRTKGGEELLMFCEQEGLVVAGSYTPQAEKATWFHNRWGTGHILDHFLVRGGDRRRVTSVKTLHFSGTQSEGHRSRLGRPLRFSVTPWLEHTDHDPVELLGKVGRDWRGEAARAAAAPSRLDVLRMLGSSVEASALRSQYAEGVSATLAEGANLISGCVALAAQSCNSTRFRSSRSLPRNQGRTLLAGTVPTTLRASWRMTSATESQSRFAMVPDLLEERLSASQHLRGVKHTWEAVWWEDLASKAERAGEEGDDFFFWQVCRSLRVIPVPESSWREGCVP